MMATWQYNCNSCVILIITSKQNGSYTVILVQKTMTVTL